MFSTSETISLFDLRQVIYEILALERDGIRQEVAKKLEYSAEREFPHIVDDVTEDLFTLFLLGNAEYWLVSVTGQVLRASNLFCEYVDRPIDDEVAVKYREQSHGSKWLFFEHPTMLLTVKNWDNFGRELLVENNATDENWIPIVAERVRPFEGWSLCVSRSACPVDISDLVTLTETILRKIGNNSNGKRGPKPTRAKQEFFRLYPDGKPEGLSAEAIAAEITAAGFSIGGRSIQNYDNELKAK